MSGIFIIIAAVVGLVVAVGMWAYSKNSRRSPGHVQPDAPTSSGQGRRTRRK